MSFARPTKQQDSISSSESIPAFPLPPTTTTMSSMDGISTPEHVSRKRAIRITHAQKQALMDNLQLEITERARKLRAQYALQAQGLRSRLEMRVNRIPQNLRKRKMQELRDEHLEKSKPAPPPPMPIKSDMTKSSSHATPTARQNLKRNSDQMSDDGDKENVPEEESQQDLANPKKRAKTVPTNANAKVTRVASKAQNTGVLSPRSQNSRLQPPKSPAKSIATNEKVTLPKSSSPVKSMAKAAVKAIGRAGSRKKVAGPAENTRTSEGSDTSNGTTVVSRAGAKKTTAASKKAAAPKANAAANKKAPAVKKEPAPTTRTAGGRTLRNRG